MISNSRDTHSAPAGDAAAGPLENERYAGDFSRLAGRSWLNAAHQGPLPDVAADAARQAIEEKRAPQRMRDESFLDVPHRLRRALAQVVGAHADDIILGNSASYGLSLLAAGIRWREGDEVLLVRGEFPASVFPWHVIESHGARLRFFDARSGNTPDANEVAAQLTSRTRVFCTSWVNSFSGHTIDVDAVARVCQQAGVLFVLNASQGLGARTLDLSHTDIDALVCCGYKWLLGPYGTGFVWIRPSLRDRLTPLPAYWLPNVWGRGEGLENYELRRDLGARAFDVFDTANFLNFVPWTAALEYLLGVGLDTVARHDDALVERLVAGVPRTTFELVSPQGGARRSTLVVVRPADGRSAEEVHATLAAAGIDVAVREGALRFAPHLYNSFADIDRALAVIGR